MKCSQPGYCVKIIKSWPAPADCACKQIITFSVPAMVKFYNCCFMKEVNTVSSRPSDDNNKQMELSAPLPASAHTPAAPGYFLHPTAILEDGAFLGPGSKVWHYSHIMRGSRIGANCNIGRNVLIGPDAAVGSGCRIQNNISIFKGITLEDEVFCGPSMVFTNVFNPRAFIPRMHELRLTLVRRGAALGAGCVIVCGVTIGQYAFVAAGAVVTRQVPAYALVMGNPARQQGWVCWCGVKLTAQLVCPACGRSYESTGDGLIPLAS
jgi:UDP-2-acetamido-3-amino-2,3-dideoxy-glucuronate N-acetyltransferase